ncbi:hypothetical protein BP6252_10923 [Coleophoma cylindrospora]|uniref:Uncharacterized protein n=1 Tax=Coleophoma cylindrospora TaxID=1849047 RepID=A0A3D8QNX5_9HELO|nr:hypothetical protein BP6252_10923 [Coleophoma cylindrospora]
MSRGGKTQKSEKSTYMQLIAIQGSFQPPLNNVHRTRSESMEVHRFSDDEVEFDMQGPPNEPRRDEKHNKTNKSGKKKQKPSLTF